MLDSYVLKVTYVIVLLVFFLRLIRAFIGVEKRPYGCRCGRCKHWKSLPCASETYNVKGMCTLVTDLSSTAYVSEDDYCKSFTECTMDSKGKIIEVKKWKESKRHRTLSLKH